MEYLDGVRCVARRFRARRWIVASDWDSAVAQFEENEQFARPGVICRADGESSAIRTDGGKSIRIRESPACE
jgi:hypothetical protein